ncbi:hypothetical protein ACOMHN_067365 [Nucella lapillus]
MNSPASEVARHLNVSHSAVTRHLLERIKAHWKCYRIGHVQGVLSGPPAGQDDSFLMCVHPTQPDRHFIPLGGVECFTCA